MASSSAEKEEIYLCVGRHGPKYFLYLEHEPERVETVKNSTELHKAYQRYRRRYPNLTTHWVERAPYDR